jgi:hypothetical protein
MPGGTSPRETCAICGIRSMIAILRNLMRQRSTGVMLLGLLTCGPPACADRKWNPGPVRFCNVDVCSSTFGGECIEDGTHVTSDDCAYVEEIRHRVEHATILEVDPDAPPDCGEVVFAEVNFSQFELGRPEIRWRALLTVAGGCKVVCRDGPYFYRFDPALIRLLERPLSPPQREAIRRGLGC